MIKNSTLPDNTTTVVELSLITYDTNGAIIYIIIVLLWYSIGIVILLGMDMFARSEETEDLARCRTKFLIRNLRDQTNTREILEELVDKQNSDRLWDIYLGTTSDRKDRLTRAEAIRIRHIEKQLATIKRNYRLTQNAVCLSTDDIRYIRSRSDYRPDPPQLSSEVPFTLRRHSSLDQQTLGRWKEFTTLSKSYEKIPWAIRKLMIRKYLRRNTKKSPISRSKRANTTIPAINDEQTDLISLSNQFPELPQERTDTDLSTKPSTINEQRNPYISYFYIPSNQPTILRPELSPE